MSAERDILSLIEERLAPLILKTRDQTELDAAIDRVAVALFKSPEEAAQREPFRRAFQKTLAAAPHLAAKQEQAIAMLRRFAATRAKAAPSSAPSSQAPAAAPAQPMAPVAHNKSLVTQAQGNPPSVMPPKPGAPGAPGAKPGAAPAAAAKPEAPPAEPAKFEDVFDDAICAHLRELLGLMIVSAPNAGLLPFFSAKPFGDALEKVVRRHILPPMRASRAITARLRDCHKWTTQSHSVVVDMIFMGEANNPIIYTWDLAWSNLQPKKTPTGNVYSDEAKALWKEFKQHGVENGYDPPRPSDLPLLAELLKFDPEVFQKALHELRQLYQQEFEPSRDQQQVREGSVRDCLNKWEAKALPSHGVEWLGIKISLEWRHLGKNWLYRFATNKGQSDEERRRAAPYLMRFLEANP